MIINNLQELDDAKKLVKGILKGTKNPFVISVYKEMLYELNRGDVENVATPSYISITRFGYDIFKNILK